MFSYTYRTQLLNTGGYNVCACVCVHRYHRKSMTVPKICLDKAMVRVAVEPSRDLAWEVVARSARMRLIMFLDLFPTLLPSQANAFRSYPVRNPTLLDDTAE
jgi:hypothetical protein